jgi:branched-chain amino acid transport system substrate-binding protein
MFLNILLVFGLLLAACSTATPAVQTQPASEATQETQPEEGLANAPAEFVAGVPIFLSGGAAAPFGVPAQNAANLLIEAINAGELPAPYNTKGIAGVPLRAVFIDESGGAEVQVSEFRRLFLDEKVNAVIGYISSTDCLAVAPVAEEIKGLTVAFDCGTARLFEDAQYKYVFRTNAHQTIDSISAARYLLMQNPDVKSIYGINQNYSWGQDSWANFRDALLKLNPDVQVLGEQFPKLGAGDFSAEISAISQAAPEYIHSSFWGADLDGFMIQAAPRGLFDASTLILSVGEYALPSLGEQILEGTLIGSHGTHGTMAPENDLNTWFVDKYKEKYGMRPTYPAYHMAQAILGLKMAVEKAAEAQGQWPSDEQVIAAFEHLAFPTPSGEIRLEIGNGHQAVEDAAFATAGAFNAATGEVDLENVVVFPASCVNPPDATTTQEWIDQGFPGATGCP